MDYSSTNICYVTIYHDIGRESWSLYPRTFEQYLKHFEPFIGLFNKDNCGDDLMVIFIDEKYEMFLRDKFDQETTNITIIPINDDFMNTLHIWKTLDREQEIMKNDSYKQLLGKRSIFPEHMYPKYTLINHCKIDLICSLFDKFNFQYYSWVDFGYFGRECNIPNKLADINKLNLNTINYTLINHLYNKDRSVIYNLQFAPEKIGGFFFFGRKDKLLEYQKLYHETLNWFQNELNIADDDQHLALQCYFKNPELFTLHYNGDWHKALLYFQKD